MLWFVICCQVNAFMQSFWQKYIIPQFKALQLVKGVYSFTISCKHQNAVSPWLENNYRWINSNTSLYITGFFFFFKSFYRMSWRIRPGFWTDESQLRLREKRGCGYKPYVMNTVHPPPTLYTTPITLTHLAHSLIPPPFFSHIMLLSLSVPPSLHL